MGFSSANHLYSTSAALNFQPCQIVYLEHEASRLYAEVVQVAESRQLCWVRPLLLVMDSSVSVDPISAIEAPSNWYDLRNGADLLYPLVLFRKALDTEVIPLLTLLYSLGNEGDDRCSDPAGHQQLKLFIKKIWQTHPDLF
jgi:hypothetical protein